MKPYVAACVQAATVAFNTERTLEKVRDFASDAARVKAKTVLFPEAFIGGYPRGASFGAVLGSRTPEGREQFLMYHSAAIDVPGPVVSELASIAKQNEMQLSVGVIERDRGTLYCTVLFFDSHGHYLGKHRKLMPTAMERLIWGFGDGSTLPVYDTEVGRIGAVICWENYMPLMRAAMYGQDIQVYMGSHRRSSPDLGNVDATHRCRGALFRAFNKPICKGAATSPLTMPRICRTTPRRLCVVAEPALLIHLAICSQDRFGIKKAL